MLGESSAMSGEATRAAADIGLPQCQKELLQAGETGKPLVLVLMNGRPLTLTWEAEHCGAHSGNLVWRAQSHGNAVTDGIRRLQPGRETDGNFSA